MTRCAAPRSRRERPDTSSSRFAEMDWWMGSAGWQPETLLRCSTMATVSSEDFFAHAAQLAHLLPDGIVVVDVNGTVVAVNARLLTMTGYAEADLVGASVDRLVPLDRRAVHVARRAQFTAHPEVLPMGSALDIVCQRADG